MIITISGVPGSGKTTIAKLVAERLGIPFYSVGALRGKMAEERGMTIDELNALGESQAFTDTDVDEYQTELGKRGEPMVMEGRLSWHFIPNSFKVFLDCSVDEAAKRIYLARQRPEEERNDEPEYTNIEAAKSSIIARRASDERRYQKYYNVDYMNPAHYDLVIDTSTVKDIETVADRIVAEAGRPTDSQ